MTLLGFDSFLCSEFAGLANESVDLDGPVFMVNKF